MMVGGEGDTQCPMDEEKMRTHLMFIEDNRVKSFKDWVFDRCECTPKKVGLLYSSERYMLFNARNARNTRKLHQRNRRSRCRRLLIQSLQEGDMG